MRTGLWKGRSVISATIPLPPKGKARPRVYRGHAFMPKDYTQWKKDFGRLWKAVRNDDTFQQLLRIDTIFHTKTGNSRSDMDNAHAAVLDALQDCGAIENDRQCRSGFYDLLKADSDYIEVTISDWGAL
jgi:Holliday junction resolvase RusA-like endonuclease